MDDLEHHYVVTYSESSGVVVYVDGAQKGSHPLKGKFDGAWTGFPSFNVGMTGNEASSQRTGEVYLTALYSRALDAAEVAQNFVAGPPPAKE